ncbi:radical SAM protein, partial [bacterium]|nr:radical SAM protein [bacterium]
EKIRLTGGEPLISAKLNDVLPALSVLDYKDISLTTNGQLLENKIRFLKECGIKRLNISLDTLDPSRFYQITRGGLLQTTLNGINKALENDIRVKINMVPIIGMNEDDIVPLLDYCLERNMELRYIELMQMGHLSERKEFVKKFIPIEKIFSKIREKYSFEPAHAPQDSTANRFKIKNKGFFGAIANDSSPFCKNCNRLRFSSTGEIHGCLSSTEKFSIRELLTLPEETAKEKLKPILAAALATKQSNSFDGSSLLMKTVGG